MPTIQNKRGLAAALAATNPVPAAGEVIYETDTRRWKLGDGITAWNSLAYGGETTAYVAKAGDTMTGQFAVTAGSVSAPGFAISGDTNTGLSQVGGADSVSVVVGGVEGLRVDANKNLIVGNATASNAGSFFSRIVTFGFPGRQGANGTSIGSNFNFWWTGSATQLWVDVTNIGNITVSSDYRIKTNVQTQPDGALARIAAIRPVTYTYADNPQLGWLADGVPREGFIAHELSDVVPSAVDGEKDATNQIQSLRLDALCSVMLKAMQEQQAVIASLEQRITALENEPA